MYVYKTTNIINGKIYIGQSNKKPEKSKTYLGSGTVFAMAFKKYGRDAFVKEVLKLCDTQNSLNAWEQIFIKKFDATNTKIGYNILKKDIGSHTKGRKMTAEELILHSERMFGLKRDDISIRNLSESKKGAKNPNFGKVFTPEERLKFGKSGDKHALFGCRYKWINNGIVNIRHPHRSKIPKGFRKGMKKIKS